jgi:hypothetical protein
MSSLEKTTRIVFDGTYNVSIDGTKKLTGTITVDNKQCIIEDGVVKSCTLVQPLCGFSDGKGNSNNGEEEEEEEEDEEEDEDEDEEEESEPLTIYTSMKDFTNEFNRNHKSKQITLIPP